MEQRQRCAAGGARQRERSIGRELLEKAAGRCVCAMSAAVQEDLVPADEAAAWKREVQATLAAEAARERTLAEWSPRGREANARLRQREKAAEKGFDGAAVPPELAVGWE